jgi:prevent-host-death family protein
METITIHKAKTQLSRLIEKACQGEEIVIARGKKPVVKLVPVEASPQKRTLGLWKGLVSYTPDAFNPLTDQEMKDLGFE